MEKEQLEKIKNDQLNEKPKQTEQKISLSQRSTKKLLNKKSLIIIAAIIIVAGTAFLLKDVIFKRAPKQIYDVAVMVRSQSNPDPAEDARNSLKAGDVLVVEEDGHSWSQTERVSYLILKMNLTEEQAARLTQGEEKEIKLKDLPAEEQERIKEEGREDEPRTETIRARQYRIKMEEFEGFKVVDLLNGQPYQDQVFDWGLVEKKRKMR